MTDNGTGDEDPTIGAICVSGLAPGDYTVSETTPPTGYGAGTAVDNTATAVTGTNCTDNLPSEANSAVFTNPPLGDIQVNFRDGGSGETSATIDCVEGATTLTPSSTTPPTGWDTSETHEDLDPGTYVCTVVLDP